METDRNRSFGWHYDLDAYVQVRLGADDTEESEMVTGILKILERNVDLKWEAYECLVAFMVRHVLFWTILADKITHSHYSLVSAYHLAVTFFPRTDARACSQDKILKSFGLRKRDVSRASSAGGSLLLSRKHERLLQLSNIDLAVQTLLALDLREAIGVLGELGPDPSEEEQDWRATHAKCDELIEKFYATVVPVAFAGLWIWKYHVRSRRQWSDDEEERLTLWRACLTLYGLAVYPEPGDEFASPADLCGVFAGNVSATSQMVLDVPILEQTLKELWMTWSALMWRTPSLVIGDHFHTCVRLLTLRCSYFSATGGNIDEFDFERYVHVPESNLHNFVSSANDLIVTANNAFLDDTERVLFYLLEAGSTARYLTPPNAMPVATREQHETWSDIVQDRIESSLSSFVQLQIEKRGWNRYPYWDEIEHFERKMHSRSNTPRKVIGDFRRSHCDAVLSVLRGKNSLSILRKSAEENMEAGAAERSTRCARTDGWAWKNTWDIRAETEAKVGADSHIPNDVEEIFDEATGNSIFVYKRTKRRVRGEKLQRIEMARSIKMSSAGAVEWNLLEETTLKILLRVEGKAEEQQQLSVFTTYKHSNRLTTVNLLSHGTQPEHKIQIRLLGEFPALISHYNTYYVFDGEKAYASTERLIDAVYAWCLACENVVRQSLDGILEQFSEEATSETNELLLQEARDIVSRVPSQFRTIFDLVRDPLVSKADPQHYKPPRGIVMRACAWDTRDIGLFFTENFPSLNISRRIAAERRLAAGGSLNSIGESDESDSDLDTLLGIEERDPLPIQRALPPDTTNALGGVMW